MIEQSSPRENVPRRVFVVDDDVTLLRSLKFLLESVQIEVETFENAQQFLDRYDGESPACVITDVRMPGKSGLDLYDELRSDGFEIPVIVITGHGDVPMAVRALQSGVFDFIEKPFSDQVLLDRIENALQRSADGERDAAWRASVRSRFERLTNRERETFTLVVRGLSNKEIAAELGVSDKTIEIHRANAMRKMQAGSLAALVRKAVVLENEGLSDAPPVGSL